MALVEIFSRNLFFSYLKTLFSHLLKQNNLKVSFCKYQDKLSRYYIGCQWSRILSLVNRISRHRLLNILLFYCLTSNSKTTTQEQVPLLIKSMCKINWSILTFLKNTTKLAYVCAYFVSATLPLYVNKCLRFRTKHSWLK